MSKDMNLENIRLFTIKTDVQPWALPHSQEKQVVLKTISALRCYAHEVWEAFKDDTRVDWVVM